MDNRNIRTRNASAKLSLIHISQLLDPQGAFLLLNLYSMGLSSTLARTAVRQAFGAPLEEQYGELCFTCLLYTSPIIGTPSCTSKWRRPRA